MTSPARRILWLGIVLFLWPAAAGALGPSGGNPGGAPVVFELDAARVLASATAGHAFVLSTPVGPFAFDLRPRPMALGAVIGENGVPVGRADRVVTFEGTANGYPARLSATGAGVFAIVLSPDPIVIQPLWMLQPDALPTRHVAVSWSQTEPTVVDSQSPVLSVPSRSPAKLATAAPANRTVHFLLEGDFTFYQKASLSGTCGMCWVEAQQALMSLAEELFEPQTGIRFNITSQWACTTATSCPYDASLGLASTAWLDAFATRWESVTDEPPHELGHLFVGTDLGPNSVGWAAGLVNTPPWGYALTEVAVGTGSVHLPFLTVAHEIGHNFNAVHAEADPIPPALVPTGAQGGVWTIMAAGKPVRYEFSAGTWDPAHNNLARIVSQAIASLPS